ncbi:MAG TPA: iron-sulfur cluster repair di-iron protein [Cyclobacteriaceae bacterium]|nr:iron-sulfur cluster repair di-iron protein [Cyclobacteriaceae bacterium]HPW61049.1 iron-sulfur cluster repair di-iron protein [Cyclobacteriaceae bacterium]
MEKIALKSQRIGELVDQDKIRAHVLFYFGIKFYEYSEQTLEQVCQEKGLSVDIVVRELESPNENFQESDLPLISYPIDLIIEYLKHTHHLFIKHKLPYIGRLVESFKANHIEYDLIEKDLKALFPLFLEDFIHHIYEEEDTLFKYIRILERAGRGHFNPSELYQLMEKHSLQRCALEHEAHDEEMRGIRKITKDYHLTQDAPLHVKVIYNELIQFEKSLKLHAQVENEILFPKAMALENEVKKKFFEKARLN